MNKVIDLDLAHISFLQILELPAVIELLDKRTLEAVGMPVIEYDGFDDSIKKAMDVAVAILEKNYGMQEDLHILPLQNINQAQHLKTLHFQFPKFLKS